MTVFVVSVTVDKRNKPKPTGGVTLQYSKGADTENATVVCTAAFRHKSGYTVEARDLLKFKRVIIGHVNITVTYKYSQTCTHPLCTPIPNTILTLNS